jgi:hypothetical protein
VQFYRHSGAMPLTGIPIVVIAGAISACVLGFAYSFATVFCPIVYVNFLLTALLGLGIGYAVAWASRIGKIRNNYVVAAYGLAFGVIGMYVSWAADMLARLGVQNGLIAKQGWDLCICAFYPDVLWRYVQFFYDNGFWTLGHHGGNGDVVKGVFLAVIWIAEAAAVLGCATVCAYAMSNALPFCETCNRWTVLHKAVRQLLPVGVREDSLRRATAGDVDALTELVRAESGARTCLQLDLASCPACQQSNFLSIRMVQRTVDSKGKEQVKKTTLLKDLMLEAADVPRVRQAGRDPAELVSAAEEPPAATGTQSPGADAPPSPEGKNGFFDFLDRQ